jgi:hypothetical protein
MAAESNLSSIQSIPDGPATTTSTEENYWTHRRLELKAWFQRNAPSLCELYEGALRMIFIPDFPGRMRFIAHAVREIRNRLPDVIAGPKTGGPVQYKNRLDDIVKNWEKCGFLADGSTTASLTSSGTIPSGHIPIPRLLFEKIDILVKEHVEGRESREEAAIRLFEGIAPEDQDLRDTLRPTIHQWLEVTEWFVKKVHAPGFETSNIDTKEFDGYFDIFEKTLGAIVRSFFKTVEELDEILEDTNS